MLDFLSVVVGESDTLMMGPEDPLMSVEDEEAFTAHISWDSNYSHTTHGAGNCVLPALHKFFYVIDFERSAMTGIKYLDRIFQ